MKSPGPWRDQQLNISVRKWQICAEAKEDNLLGSRERTFEMRLLPTRDDFRIPGVHGNFLGNLIRLLVSVAHICKFCFSDE